MLFLTIVEHHYGRKKVLPEEFRLESHIDSSLTLCDKR